MSYPRKRLKLRCPAMRLNENMNKSIPFKPFDFAQECVRQARDKRNRLLAVRPELVEALNQKLLARILLPLFLFLISAEDSHAELKMHIFNNAPIATVTPKAHKAMQMIVFPVRPSINKAVNKPVTSTPPQPLVATPKPLAKTLAQSKPAAISEAKPSIELESHFDIGYRHDQVDWNIAGLNGTPNILSELQWQNIQSVMLNTGAALSFADNWYGEANLGYGNIFDGRNQDSDYFLDNRQGEFSRSNNLTEDGATIDLSGAIGYHLNIGWKNTTPNLRLTPKLGYAFHTQQFNTTQGFQTIPAFGSFDGLDSYYDATWFGPWGGLATRFNVSKALTLDAQVDYHLADYEGTGNWNLRDDFAHPQSFTHKAEGYGITASALARYRLNNDWTLRLSANWQTWQAHHSGVDTTNFSDGTSLTTGFNGANWDSYGFNFGVEYRF